MELLHRSYKKKITRGIQIKREAHPSLASRFQAPENCPPLSKRATPNFTPIHIYHTLYTRYTYGKDTP